MNRFRPTAFDRIRLHLVKAGYASANVFLAFVRSVLWPRHRPTQPHSICVYRIGNVGDTICSLPALRALRRAYPEARLVLFTSPGRASLPSALDVLRSFAWIDQIVVYHDVDIETWTGRLQLLRRLRREQFDLWFELPSNMATLPVLLRNMLFAKLAGAKWAAGWRLCTIRLWAQLQSNYVAFSSEVERLLQIVREEGIAVEAIDYGPELITDTGSRTRHLLAQVGIHGEQPFIVVAPGAKRSTNHWPEERWTEVVSALCANGHRVVLLGGPAEIQLCMRIAAVAGSRAANLAGRTRVEELPAILYRAVLAVCVDSGIQHIASAVGTPCVSLFSAWQHKGKWYPQGDHTVIEKRVHCHTCLLDRCPRDNLCMREISVSEVIAACEKRAPSTKLTELHVDSQ